VRIQKSIKKAIDELNIEDYEAAMLHVCNAIDGTAQKKNGAISSKSLFVDFIRGYYDYIGAMTGTYFLDYKNINWPVTVQRPSGAGGKTDLADFLYSIHRCKHAHGTALPDGFEFHADIKSNSQTTTFSFKPEKVRLSDRFIWALIAIVVLEPVNRDLVDGELDGYYINLGNKKYLMNDWWGRLNDIPPLPPKTQNVILDFDELRSN